jgi:hypothetical protein
MQTKPPQVTTFGEYDVIVIPEVEGRAWVNGRNEYSIDPDDPLKEGFVFRYTFWSRIISTDYCLGIKTKEPAARRTGRDPTSSKIAGYWQLLVQYALRMKNMVCRRSVDSSEIGYK